MNPVKEMQGKLSGSWEVLQRAGTRSDGQALWLCLCRECGAKQVHSGVTLRLMKSQACRGCSKRKSDRWYEALELDEQGMTYAEIGTRMGVSKTRAFQLVQKGREDREARKK